MRRKLDSYLGRKINRLTIVEILPLSSPGAMKMARCKCECGKEIITSIIDVVREKSQSCGCLSKERNAELNYKHGLTHHPFMRVFYCVKSRCYNENDPSYHNYGGRGIRMCEEWKDDVQKFYEWAILNGWRQGLDINRIDNNGNYEPTNCNCITRKENSRNRRVNRYITYKGMTKCLSEWSECLSISRSCLNWRLDHGWNIEDAFTTPSQFNNK